jgi:putative ABC transport system permease protein
MDVLRQVIAVTAMGLRTIPSRLGASLVVVVGMACAVGALVSILSMSTGFLQTMKNAGRPDRVIVLSQGSLFEYSSALPRGNITTIADAPGVRKTADGKAVASADAMAYAMVTKIGDGFDTYVIIRGVGPQAMALRPEIHLVSGRMFQPGKYEVIVGRAAQSQFKGLGEGSKIAKPEGDWTVTGTFESNMSASESELLTDAPTLLSAMRANTYKSMTVMLNAPGDFSQFKNALTHNPTLVVDVTREQEYLAAQSRWLNKFLTVIAYVVGGIMGLGAMFGALNTMYSAVSARAREIATLRAIGFGGAAVVASVLTEALLCCLAGAAIGVVLALIAFNGHLHAMGNTVIRLAVTWPLALTGVSFACLLGFIGGLFPAIRAARQPIVDGLRAS